MKDIDDIVVLLSEIDDSIELNLKPLISEAYDAEDVVGFTRVFVRVRHLKDKLEAVTKQFNQVYEDLKVEKLPQKFEGAGVPTVHLDEGYRVTMQHKLYASVKGGKKDEAIAWLEANELGDIVTQTINSSTLSAVAKSLQEDNRELDAELFSVAIIPNPSVTKIKK